MAGVHNFKGLQGHGLKVGDRIGFRSGLGSGLGVRRDGWG